MTLTADLEALFPPRPGGMVDTVRQQNAAEAAQAAMPTEETATGYAYKPVDVLIREPEVVSSQTYAVSTTLNPVLRVLGADVNRKRAVIMTLDEPVVVCNSQASASDSRNASAGTAGNGAGGFVLPAVSDTSFSPILEIQARGEVWVAATSSTATRVCVWVETYDDSAA